MKEINWKNDPLLHLEKYKYIIKQRFINAYRALVLIDDLKSPRWMIRTPYVKGKNLFKKLRALLKDFGKLDSIVPEILERLEKYIGHTHVKRSVGLRTLKKQFKQKKINLIVLRCISLLLEEYINKPSIEIFLEMIKNVDVYCGGFKRYNQFKIPLTLSQVLSNEQIYLVGVICGDGHICRNDLHVEIIDGHHNKNLLKFSRIYLHKLKKLIFQNFKVRSYIKRKGNTYLLNITSKWLGTYLHNFFNIPIGKKASKISIPEILFLLPKKAALERLTFFWRGMFDTDGSVNLNMSNFQITFATKSKIIDSLEKFLLNPSIGISYTRRKEKGVYKIEINIADYLKFARKIGSYHPLKIRALVKHLMKGPTFYTKKKWRRLSTKEVSILVKKWETLRTPHLS
jgi:hypothetical protein